MPTLIDRITTAIARNNLAALRKLVTRDNVNLEDEDGFTLVMNVILDEDADAELLRLLIERGADVNVAERDQRYTALHFAARDQRREMVEILLAAGAQPDPLDASSKTPLCHCVQRLEPNMEIVKLLLASGADPKKRSKDGDSPLNVARYSKDAELLALLKGSPANRKSSGAKVTRKPAMKKKTTAKQPQPAAKVAKVPRKQKTALKPVATASQQGVAEQNVGWSPDHGKLWRRLVPRSGKAKTVQGEVIRLTGRLADEAFRNGNINWSASHANAWKFVGATLDDPAVFLPVARAEIKRNVRWILRHITQVPVTAKGSAYYILADRAVKWCQAHTEPILLKRNLSYDF